MSFSDYDSTPQSSPWPCLAPAPRLTATRGQPSEEHALGRGASRNHEDTASAARTAERGGRQLVVSCQCSAGSASKPAVA